jgi:ATP-dependent Zn protease
MLFVRKVKTINKPCFHFIIGNYKKKTTKQHKKRTHRETKNKQTNKTKQNKTSKKHQQHQQKTKQAKNTSNINKKQNKATTKVNKNKIKTQGKKKDTQNKCKNTISFSNYSFCPFAQFIFCFIVIFCKMAKISLLYYAQLNFFFLDREPF